ncbi:two-component response regulator [Staphylococcus schleiferi]|uniref:response regulator transcription factor n=1 Tax=Staphylococcus coagulans TaxID=74706 RepID=UPI0006BCA3BB|nr:response regulator transcription factor [Staphylococcus coagulans]PNZ10464.1 DNA-binding response regulator [Staphylococcus coagulans]BAS44931.1 two-component response regulator [Staphylococcus schleiferi]
MINVIIAEDQTMLRQAMVQLIEMHNNIHVVADVGDGQSVLKMAQETEADVLILDVEMPKLTGLEVLQQIREDKVDIKVIIVTTFKRPGYFEKAVALDVDAYVLKERSIDELVDTIHRVMSGQKEYSEALMTSIFTERNPLTPKEQLVLKEIGKGLSSREIANTLFLSDGTIRNYTSTVIDKLEADNRFDAWKKAHDKGWL